MTAAQRAIHGASRARDLCLSLARSHRGPRALERLRAGGAASLDDQDLQIALGLAWAAGDRTLVREALALLPRERVDEDARLAALRAACGDPAASGGIEQI